MWERLKRVWNSYKDVAAVRGFLQWIGYWQTAIAVAGGFLAWLWARARHLQGPEQLVLGFGLFTLILAFIALVLWLKDRKKPTLSADTALPHFSIVGEKEVEPQPIAIAEKAVQPQIEALPPRAPAPQKVVPQPAPIPVEEPEPTLVSLMDTSFPRFDKLAKDMPIKFDDGTALMVRTVLYFEKTANATFLGFHVPSSPDTVAACLILAKQAREIAQHMAEGGLLIRVRAQGENPQEVRNYSFTGKVYIHHDDHLSHKQMGEIEDAFHLLKLEAVLRGPDFLTLAWIAWKEKSLKRK